MGNTSQRQQEADIGEDSHKISRTHAARGQVHRLKDELFHCFSQKESVQFPKDLFIIYSNSPFSE